jgi:uncharacterized protein YjbI with pentapeptide repeats
MRKTKYFLIVAIAMFSFLSGASAIGSERETPTQEKIILILKTSKNFDNIDLSGRNLDGQDLQGASFMNADLTDVSFKNANLSFADFKNANVNRADFSGAVLTGARNFESAENYQHIVYEISGEKHE